MNRLILALAFAPALLATGAQAQTVTDDVTKQLWCGTAFVIAFSDAPEGATAEQLAEAKVYIDGGNSLIDTATQAHLDAGFTEEQVTKLKADLVDELKPVVANGGDPSKAKYTFEECAALVQAAMSSAPAPDASSSAAM